MLHLFTPHLCVTDVTSIPLQELSRRGIRGLLLDLDNTLLERKAQGFDSAVTEWVATVKSQGFGLCLVTNAPPDRAEPMAARLGVPGVPRSNKPLTGGLRKGLELLGLRPDQAAMVGDQLFTDVWAGNRLGMYTILVRPISRQESILTRVKRPLERWLLMRMRDTVPGLAEALAAEGGTGLSSAEGGKITGHGSHERS